MKDKTLWVGVGLLAVALVIGQVGAFVMAPTSWAAFAARLPIILAQIGFWGPICAIFSAAFVFLTFRLLGFETLEEIRHESVEQNNPAPAIVFVGTLIASILFLSLVIRP